jgi:hypothetical protein
MTKTISFTLTDDEYAKLTEIVRHINATMQTEGKLAECHLPNCWAGALADAELRPDGTSACPDCGGAIGPPEVPPPVYTPAAYARDTLLDDLGLTPDSGRPTE